LKCASERVFVHWCKDIHLQIKTSYSIIWSDK
jgi:hypothetical protein